MKHSEKSAAASIFEAQEVTKIPIRTATRRLHRTNPTQQMTAGKSSTVPALIWADLPAIHMPGQAWALAMIHPTRRATGGFPVGDVTKS
ncbi:hypothetical protein [Rhodobacter sp. NTK016B]|uniref:hypothetical protein n=1 Tax=Rhodobacter sp. NTK016B TaxID=2759676 RepID=UPI00257050F7|nr:hypothetical protein [Rhodobacter sp. NTK016B]